MRLVQEWFLRLSLPRSDSHTQTRLHRLPTEPSSVIATTALQVCLAPRERPLVHHQSDFQAAQTAPKCGGINRTQPGVTRPVCIRYPSDGLRRMRQSCLHQRASRPVNAIVRTPRQTSSVARRCPACGPFCSIRPSLYEVPSAAFTLPGPVSPDVIALKLRP